MSHESDQSPDPDSPVSLSTDPDPEPPGAEQASPLRRRRLPSRTPRVSDEHGFGSRLTEQLTQLRNERQARMSMPVPQRSAYAADGPRQAKVPYGVDLAAAWIWRLLVIGLGVVVLYLALSRLGEVVVPLVVALLITALVVPLVEVLERAGVRRTAGSAIVLLLTLGVVVALLTLAGQQIAAGSRDLADQTAEGLDQVRDYLTGSPFNLSEKRLNEYTQTIQERARDYAAGNGVGQVAQIGTTVGHVFAGVFIALLSTFFFLADGSKIWAWLVRLTPREAREQVDSSGRVAWTSLTQYTRATVIVAIVDAVLTALAAAILQVPFVLAIGVLVFLGAFIPLIGATVAGSVAVLVALVDRGPVIALIMLACVVGVQQVEAHGLQPFLMGRWVSVHPLGVIVALAVGIILAGIAGALISVPLAAALNAVGQHLAAGTTPGGDPEQELQEDYGGPPPEPA